MEVEIPPEFRCPISQDVMNEPVVVTHDGVGYKFDEVPLKTWKKTPNGDKNPLTMMSGFLGADVKKDGQLKDRIKAFRLEHGMSTDEVTDEVQLTPFSDYQQIQDDEDAAHRLHLELNGPPSINNADGNYDEYIIRFEGLSFSGVYEVDIPEDLMETLVHPDMPQQRIDIISSIINILNNQLRDAISVEADSDLNVIEDVN